MTSLLNGSKTSLPKGKITSLLTVAMTEAACETTQGAAVRPTPAAPKVAIKAPPTRAP